MMKKKSGLLLTAALFLCLMLSMTAAAAPKKDGWYQRGTGWYYAKDGKKVTGWMKDKGRKYYLRKDKNGRMAVGWYKLQNKWYYFEPQKAPIGAMQTGWQTIDGKKYYLGKVSGVMYTGKRKIHKTTYLFADSGELLGRPRWRQNQKGRWYDNGDGTYPKFTWQAIDGRSYFFDRKGYVLTGWQEINSKYYYLGKTGAMETSKWIKINGHRYYVQSDGTMATCKWIKERYVGTDGYWIKKYQSADAKIKEGWVGSNSTVRYNKNNSAVVNWRYYHNGVLLKGWNLIGGKYYYFEKDGYMRVGWLDRKGNRYFMNTVKTKQIGTMAVGWFRIDGKLYYFFPTGKMARNQTLLASDKKHYTFDQNGICVKVS